MVGTEDEVTGRERSRLRGRGVKGGPCEREAPWNSDPTPWRERCPQQGLAWTVGAAHGLRQLGLPEREDSSYSEGQGGHPTSRGQGGQTESSPLQGWWKGTVEASKDQT